VIAAIVVAIGLLGLVVVESINNMPLQQQQAFARGCPADAQAPNASKTRCVDP
jgi:hypothetical protein